MLRSPAERHQQLRSNKEDRGTTPKDVHHAVHDPVVTEVQVQDTPKVSSSLRGEEYKKLDGQTAALRSVENSPPGRKQQSWLSRRPLLSVADRKWRKLRVSAKLLLSNLDLLLFPCTANCALPMLCRSSQYSEMRRSICS